MADLMKGTYTFDALAEKYGNFCVPLVRIKMNGTELVKTMKLAVVELTVKLSVEAAGMAVFKIGGIYDVESHRFDSKVKNKFVPGAVVDIEIGYLSAAQKIFRGFVASVGAEFGKLPVLVVTLMDARRLMMLSGNRRLLHDVKNYSDAFKKVIGDYTKLCSAVVDATQDKLEHPVSQTQNDYLFVTQELIKNKRIDREFFVLGDKAYFRKPRAEKTPIMTMKLGKELLGLQVDESYLDLQVEVIGYDPNKQEILSAKEKVAGAKKQKKLMSKTPVFALTDPDADTQDKASARAKMLAQEKEWGMRRGRGTAIGLPELVPGRYVAVQSLEKDFADHKYYITEVTHVISGEHFRTSFEIGGWL